MRTQSFSFDYLQFISQMTDVPLASMATYPLPDSYGLISEDAHNGYAVAYRNRLGALVQWNVARVDMGIQTTYSGMAIAAYYAKGVTSMELFRHHIRSKANCNRIDLAIDVRDTGMHIERWYKRAKRGKVETRCKDVNMDVNIDGGITLYVGARTSDKFLRIYDKAKERHVDGDWKRIELECKGKVAYQLGRVFGVMTDEEIIARAKGIIRNHIDFKQELWDWCVGNEPCPIVIPSKKADNIAAWLDKQVIPALINYLKKGGNPDVLDYIRDKVNERLQHDAK